MYFPLKNAIYNTANIGIGIGSVSADLKKRISVIYRIGRFKKWDLSVYIGIGRYEKKLIGRTLTPLKKEFYHNVDSSVNVLFSADHLLLLNNIYLNT